MNLQQVLYAMREEGAEIEQTFYPHRTITDIVKRNGVTVRISSATLEAALRRKSVRRTVSSFATFTKHRYVYVR